MELNEHLRKHQGDAAAAVGGNDANLICHYPNCGIRQSRRDEVMRHVRKHTTMAMREEAARG